MGSELRTTSLDHPLDNQPAAQTVSIVTVLAYGPSMFGLAGLFFFVQLFFLNYATDVLLIAPATIGVIFAIGRFWDAISDPIVGVLSDRTVLPLGRRRPWMLAAVPAVALTFVMLWCPPRSLTDSQLIMWISVALLSFFTALTAWLIPHQALGAELTDNYHGRSRIFGVRHAAFMLGIFFAFGGMQYVTNAPAPRAAAEMLAVTAALVACPILLVPPVFLRERSEYQGRNTAGSYKAFADLFHNPHARLLFPVWFIEVMGLGVQGSLAPYVMIYILKRPDLIGIIPAFYIFSSIASIPVWVQLSHRFGKREVWIVSMLGTACSFGPLFFVGPGDLIFLSIFLAWAGFFSGCGGAVGPSILADVIDDDEYRTGERKEGIYSAVWGFAIKAGQGIIVLLVGVVLQVSGFEPNVEQTPEANMAIRTLLAGIPFVTFLVGAIVFGRFRLDAEEYARIHTALAQRAESSV